MRRLALLVRLPAVCSILMIAGSAWSDPAPQPLLKRGSCPSGYHVSGNYCLSGSSGRTAIPKVGSCPSGWSVSGDYCLERR
jgi:hypothetical protein